MAERFPPKVDWWLVLLLIGIPVVLIWAEGLQGLIAAAAVSVVLAALMVPMHYEITETELVVRSGFMRSRVPLNEIMGVWPTRNPLSAPAPSLDRLHIDCPHHGAGLALVSPKDKDRFLDALAARTPLVREGNRLVMPGREETP